MFWLDRVYEQASSALKNKIESGETLLVRDEKTASGHVHVGSMRALVLHAAIAERLDEAGIKNVFKFEINDIDPMDGIPAYLDEATYGPYRGKPLFRIPSPDASSKSYADYFGDQYIEDIHTAKFFPEFYRGSELYRSGQMNNAIRLALERAEIVQRIYLEVSNANRPGWFPLSVICEQCGKIGTTKVSAFDGEKVTYTCEPRMVAWAEGCGHRGSVSPFDGNAKLPWKIEWAAKWFTLGVDIEGGGKDHYSKGGARDVAERVSKEVFEYDPPFGVPNEFFLVGGKKMSSSKGQGYTASDMVKLVPPRMLRLALFQKDVNQQINFDPTGDTIPVLFDTYDRLAAKYFEDVEDDDTRLFLYAHPPDERKNVSKRYLPRFSSIAFLVQMPHLDLLEEVSKMKGDELTAEDVKEVELRAKYARLWLERAASDDFKYSLQRESVPDGAKLFTDAQKQALKHVRSYVETHKTLDGQELHTALHEIRQEHELEPKDFFGALYISFLGKPSGPKAGWFLSVLDRSLLLSRLKEVST